MMKHRILLLTTLMATFTPFMVQAQTSDSNLPHLQANDLKQFPSIIEVSGEAVGGPSGTQFVLRCGYIPNGNSITPDPTLNDLSLLNPQTQTFARYQNINGKPVIGKQDTSKVAPPGARQIISQVTEPDGNIIAKSCIVSLSSDQLQNCTPAIPFLSVAQATQATQAVEAQCAAFMQQAVTQIKAGVYDAQKTQSWKAGLNQTLMTLEQ